MMEIKRSGKPQLGLIWLPVAVNATMSAAKVNGQASTHQRTAKIGTESEMDPEFWRNSSNSVTTLPMMSPLMPALLRQNFTAQSYHHFNFQFSIINFPLITPFLHADPSHDHPRGWAEGTHEWQPQAYREVPQDRHRTRCSAEFSACRVPQRYAGWNY
jgi:hypothetical protein